MGCGKFWIGMATGLVVGAVAYHCARTEKAKQMKAELCNKFRNMRGKAGDYIDDVKEKAMDTGVRVADKIAEKADAAKDKMHDFARDTKR